jgi:hypothetical protein
MRNGHKKCSRICLGPAAIRDEDARRTWGDGAAAELREKYAMLGLDPVGSSPVEFKAFLAAEVHK